LRFARARASRGCRAALSQRERDTFKDQVEDTMRDFSETFRVLLGICVVLAITLSPSVPANAQVSGATLSGTVTDASGAVIPGVMISIKNRDTGIVRNAMTDEAGFYSAPNLQAGNYDVTAPQPGFNPAQASHLG